MQQILCRPFARIKGTLLFCLKSAKADLNRQQISVYPNPANRNLNVAVQELQDTFN